MEEIARFDLDMDGSMDAFEDGRWVRYDDVQIKIAALEAERDALRADAERYRWLKAWEKLDGWTDEQIDRESAIDAAIAAKEPK